MSLFQKSVLNKYLQTLDSKELEKSFQKFNQFYGDQERLENIKLLKEENYQEGFLREIFVDVLGYTINPNKNYNLTTEFKNETDSKKADGAILLDSKAIGVIELKSTKTTDMESIIDQAFNYKNHQSGCKYVITSNFEKLRFYIDNATEFEEFYLFDLDFERFKIFYLLLSSEKLLNNIPAKIKKESQLHEENISDKLYKDYSDFKYKIYRNLIKNNHQYDKLLLFKKSQKLLDRILFILFAEDSGLVPPNAISEIIKQWQTLIDLDEKQSLYSRFIKFFHHLDVGHKYSKFELPAYNGGLFKKDDVLDNVSIDDEVLLNDALKLSSYDYSTEVDVNILGHIFEHSITEIEEITAELEGTDKDSAKSKRKKEGVFYTPKYITKYIVENTIGELCNSKKKELNLDEIDEEILENSRTVKGKLTKKAETLFNNLQTYREYILSLKILDPACGSGAFLNQALDFLIEEHKWIDEQRSRLLKESFVIVEYEKDILEQNLYGVDINEEAVEIAKLSLWLRTARKGRKLSDLSSNIKCGNSLIDDPEVAGDKAFNWEKEFPEIMNNGGFDVVIGNPPYVFTRENLVPKEKEFYNTFYETTKYQLNTYMLFTEKSIKILRENGKLGLILPNSWLMVQSGENLREFLLSNTELNSIVNLIGYSFQQVNVETIILILSKRIKLNDEIKIYSGEDEKITYLHSNKQTSFLNNDGFEFRVFMDDSAQKIILKMETESELLDNLCQIKAGLQAYEVGKGVPKQTRFDVENRPYDYAYKYDENTYKYLDGKNVGRYKIEWTGSWLRYGEHLAAPRTLNIFTNPKIIIREITSEFPKCILATYSEYPYLFNRSNIAINEKEDFNFSLKYILGLLNSKLFSFYFIKNTAKSVRKMFPKLILLDLRKFPIKITNEEKKKLIIELVDRNLELNSELFDFSNKFARSILNNTAIDKLSNKLTEFYKYDFKTFLDELKKKKVTLSLKEQDEWEEYFNEHKQKILELQYQIDQTDKEIDQLVYQLYGLTEEEIKIVEESTN